MREGAEIAANLVVVGGCKLWFLGRSTDSGDRSGQKCTHYNRKRQDHSGGSESEFEREDARKDSLDEGRWEIGPIAATAVIANLDTQTRG